MRFEEEMSEQEIADRFGVSESRISQLLNGRIKREVESAVLLGEVMDTYRDDVRYSKLQVDWIKL